MRGADPGQPGQIGHADGGGRIIHDPFMDQPQPRRGRDAGRVSARQTCQSRQQPFTDRQFGRATCIQRLRQCPGHPVAPDQGMIADLPRKNGCRHPGGAAQAPFIQIDGLVMPALMPPNRGAVHGAGRDDQHLARLCHMLIRAAAQILLPAIIGGEHIVIVPMGRKAETADTAVQNIGAAKCIDAGQLHHHRGAAR